MPAAKYNDVRGKILELVDRLEIGDPLPAERSLAVQMGVSRETLRRAIRELAREGVLERQQGRGTFVSGPRLAQGLTITSFSEDVRARGRHPGATTVEWSDETAGPRLAERLAIRTGDHVLRITRLRRGDHEPLAIEHLHVPLGRVPGLRAADLDDSSYYQLLVERYGLVVAEGEQTIEVTAVNNEEALLLDVAVGTPAFLFERTSFDGAGQPLEFVRSIYRGDRFRLVTKLAMPDGRATTKRLHDAAGLQR